MVLLNLICCRNDLYREGQGRLETMDLVDALYAFIEWLDSLGGMFHSISTSVLNNLVPRYLYFD